MLRFVYPLSKLHLILSIPILSDSIYLVFFLLIKFPLCVFFPNLKLFSVVFVCAGNRLIRNFINRFTVNNLYFCRWFLNFFGYQAADEELNQWNINIDQEIQVLTYIRIICKDTEFNLVQKYSYRFKLNR